jgi:regulator of replication initiation timing
MDNLTLAQLQSQLQSTGQEIEQIQAQLQEMRRQEQELLIQAENRAMGMHLPYSSSGKYTNTLYHREAEKKVVDNWLPTLFAQEFHITDFRVDGQQVYLSLCLANDPTRTFLCTGSDNNKQPNCNNKCNNKFSGKLAFGPLPKAPLGQSIQDFIRNGFAEAFNSATFKKHNK